MAVEDIPDTGQHIDIEAPAAVRPAVAALAGIRDLPRLSAAFDLTRLGPGVHVTGRVSARVGQICVVTLEPIESEVEEAVDLARGLPGGGGHLPDLARFIGERTS